MAIVLQILGALFLALILGVVFLFLFIRAKARQFMNTLGTMAEELQKAAATPSEIELVSMAVNDWDDADAVHEQTEPLAGLGFEKAGDFEVRPVEGLRIEAWVKPSEGVTAVVYEHPQAAVWMDLVTHYEDGTRITYLNSAVGDGVDHSPGHEVVRLPGLSPGDLYRRFAAERPSKPTTPVTASEFPAVFEKAYANEMAWRNAQGGPSEREIRAVAALSGTSYSDEDVEMTRALLAERAAEQLMESLRNQFLNQSGISASEWEHIRDRVVIIHDNLSTEMVGDLLAEYCDEDDVESFDDDSDAPMIERFATFNERLAANRRFRLLGTLREPVAAAVYCAPE